VGVSRRHWGLFSLLSFISVGGRHIALKEAFRVLKPSGRFAVSDVVVRGNVPAEIKKNMELWVGCVAGALSDYE
jgi:arsenite methyltransferase